MAIALVLKKTSSQHLLSLATLKREKTAKMEVKPALQSVFAQSHKENTLLSEPSLCDALIPGAGELWFPLTKQNEIISWPVSVSVGGFLFH